MTRVQEQRLWALMVEICGPDLRSVMLMVTIVTLKKGGQLSQEALLICEPKPKKEKKK